MEILRNILLSLLFSIPFIFVGILYDNWISTRGYSRSSRGAVIFAAIFGCIVKPFIASSISWWWYSLIMLAGVTLVIHQFDRRETWYRGSFWWKREESIKKHERKKSVDENNSALPNKNKKSKPRLSTKQENYLKHLRKTAQKKQKDKSNL